MGAFTVNIKGLRGAGDMQHDSIEFHSRIRSGDGHVLGVGQSCQTVTRKECDKEIQGVFLSDVADRFWATTVAIITPIVGCE